MKVTKSEDIRDEKTDMTSDKNNELKSRMMPSTFVKLLLVSMHQ